MSSSPVLLFIYTVLVPLLFGTVIHTSLNNVVEMFLISCFTGFSLFINSHMPYYAEIKAYNITIQEFCTVRLKLMGVWAASLHLANTGDL